MTPASYYLHPSASLSELDFHEAHLVEVSTLERRAFLGLDPGLFVAFSSERDLMRFGMARLSFDAQFIELASLGGSLRIPVSQASEGSLAHLIGVRSDGGIAFRASLTLSFDWSPAFHRKPSSLKALPLSDRAALSPLVDRSVFRSTAPGSLIETLVFLPSAPRSLCKTSHGLEIQCASELFLITDDPIAEDIHAGLALWILPDAEGNFVF